MRSYTFVQNPEMEDRWSNTLTVSLDEEKDVVFYAENPEEFNGSASVYLNRDQVMRLISALTALLAE